MVISDKLIARYRGLTQDTDMQHRTDTQHRPAAGLTYWKYIDNAWTPMTDGVTLAGNTATLTIADNGPFDADDSKGSIADPSGPAAPPEPIPTLSVWGLLASAGLLGLFGAWRQRRWRRGAIVS